MTYTDLDGGEYVFRVQAANNRQGSDGALAADTGASLSAQEAEQAATRKLLVGSGDRSERIRTYNYPQGRVTDHRINLTLYKLDEILEGGLDQVIEPLANEYQADKPDAYNGAKHPVYSAYVLFHLIILSEIGYRAKLYIYRE